MIAWQKAQKDAVDIYTAFRTLKDYGFKDQIGRAVVSISNNIAEGFDRGTNPDFARCLFIAIASCSEVKSMLYLAGKLGYIKEKDSIKLLESGDEISMIIRGLIKSLRIK